MRSRLISCLSVVAAAAFLFTGCSNPTGDTEKGGSTKPLKVYATTGYLADAVKNIAPEAQITTMVGPGGDPHTYQPSTKDIEQIRSADIVLWNGLHLEAKMGEQLSSLGDKQIAVGDKLPKELLLDWPEKDDAGNSLHDPHVWNSPKAWSLAVGYIADALAKIEPAQAVDFKKNASAYQAKIEAMTAEAKQKLAKVPDPRILITGHDAFNYFGKEFDLKVYATDFVSTEAARSAEEISELAKLIADNKVPVIFQDNQANPQAITSLREAVRARGWNVEISKEELYADSLGTTTPVDTYLGVYAHNAKAVSDALSAGKK